MLLPAGTVQRVDHEDRKVYVDRTKDQLLLITSRGEPGRVESDPSGYGSEQQNPH